MEKKMSSGIPYGRHPHTLYSVVQYTRVVVRPRTYPRKTVNGLVTPCIVGMEYPRKYTYALRLLCVHLLLLLCYIQRAVMPKTSPSTDRRKPLSPLESNRSRVTNRVQISNPLFPPLYLPYPPFPGYWARRRRDVNASTANLSSVSKVNHLNRRVGRKIGFFFYQYKCAFHLPRYRRLSSDG